MLKSEWKVCVHFLYNQDSCALCKKFASSLPDDVYCVLMGVELGKFYAVVHRQTQFQNMIGSITDQAPRYEHQSEVHQ